MMHVTRLLGGAQCQVVVLPAVESAAQASQPPEERLADGQAVQQVHDRVQVVRGPVGLVVRLAVRAIGLDLVLVGVQQVEVRRGGGSRSAISARACACSSSSWSRRAMNSPVACSAARLVASQVYRGTDRTSSILMRGSEPR